MSLVSRAPHCVPEALPQSDVERVARLGRRAVAALYDELELSPKPGLVSFVDSGSHRDMDATTFMRSLFSLRRAFPAFAMLGARGAAFAELEHAGIQAEAQMLGATGGVNTHRGAIFTLGLLSAAAGRCSASGQRICDENLRSTLLASWGPDLASRARRSSESNGARVARRFGLRSLGVEAAEGFPVLFEIVWPALRNAIEAGLPLRLARVQALFASMAVLDDTNLVHRGGMEGLRHVQQSAWDFLACGGAARPGAEARALSLHRDLMERKLSPGGSADLLAAACWLHRVSAAH